jgi:hypothetical protein
MKQQASFRTIAIILGIFTASFSYGQIAKTKTINPDALLKTSIGLAKMSETDNTAMEQLKNTNEKLYRNFSRMFKGANGIHVIPQGKNTNVICKVDGISNNILFTNKGYWLHTVRYYEPELLPAHTLRMMKETFPEAKMTLVSEVTTPNGKAKLINMETNTMYKTIRVINDEWDVYKEYYKYEQPK